MQYWIRKLLKCCRSPSNLLGNKRQAGDSSGWPWSAAIASHKPSCLLTPVLLVLLVVHCLGLEGLAFCKQLLYLDFQYDGKRLTESTDLVWPGDTPSCSHQVGWVRTLWQGIMFHAVPSSQSIQSEQTSARSQAVRSGATQGTKCWPGSGGANRIQVQARSGRQEFKPRTGSGNELNQEAKGSHRMQSEASWAEEPGDQTRSRWGTWGRGNSKAVWDQVKPCYSDTPSSGSGIYMGGSDGSAALLAGSGQMLRSGRRF